MPTSICCSSTITYASGSEARGKYSARMSWRFARITLEPVTIDRSVNAKTNTPASRKAG